MNLDKIFELLTYTIPSVVTGGVAFYFFSKHIAHEENRRRFYLHKEHQKTSFPLRLQAYERMVLYLERINPNKLLTRERPLSDDHIDYLKQLVSSVEKEFEHNLSQQIYMSDKAWDMIVTAKNTTLQTLRNTAASGEIKNTTQFQEAVIMAGLEETHAAVLALSFLKKEVADLF